MESEVGCTPEKTRRDPGVIGATLPREAGGTPTSSHSPLCIVAGAAHDGSIFSRGHRPAFRMLAVPLVSPYCRLHDTRPHPSRVWRTGPVAAPLPDIAAGVAEGGAAVGRDRPLRGLRPDNGRPQRRSVRRHLVAELVSVGRPCRAATRRVGLEYLPHRR